MTKSALLSQNGSIHTFRSSIEYESVLSRHDKFVDDWNDNNLPNTLEKGGIEIVRDQGKLYGSLCVAVTSNSDNGDTNSSNGNEIFNEGMSVAKYAVALSYNSIGDFTFLIRTGVILVIFVMSFQLLKEKDT